MKIPPPRQPIGSKRPPDPLLDLPPLVDPGAPSPGKILRGVLGLLVAAAIVAGIFWFVTRSIQGTAKSNPLVNTGLQTIAGELWAQGTSPAIRVDDPALMLAIRQLKVKVDGMAPQILVVPGAVGGGGLQATHELSYLLGKRPMLSVQIFFDEEEGKVDIISFEVGAEFQEALKMPMPVKPAAAPQQPAPNPEAGPELLIKPAGIPAKPDN